MASTATKSKSTTKTSAKAPAKSATTKKVDEPSTSQPVSPRTPQTTPVERTNVAADAGGAHTPRTAGTAQNSGSTKKSDLNVYRVRHDGHDRPGFSVVAADTADRALQLAGDAMVANDLGHTHGRMQALPVGENDAAAQFKPSSEGVIAFDNGKHA
jgi:hypothetical protein